MFHRLLIVDNRDANIYSGENIEPYAAKPGHIPTAKSLPAPLMWNPDGTFKSIDELKDLASAVVKKDDKIILYCGVGGYASSWWFVLTQVLGYKDVKFYDGSAQEWAKYNDLVMN
jgi:thiosulfate/3-mercaptopyruvate sulfurtransferase